MRFSRVPLLWIVPLLGATVVLAACDEEAPSPARVETAEMIALSDGVAVPRPAGFKQISMPGSVSLVEVADRRQTMDILVTLTETSQDKRPGAKGRDDGPTPARFTINTLGAVGSGGATWELVAWRAAGEKWILLQATQQSEHGQPNFHAAWSVFDGIQTK